MDVSRGTIVKLRVKNVELRIKKVDSFRLRSMNFVY